MAKHRPKAKNDPLVFCFAKEEVKQRRGELLEFSFVEVNMIQRAVRGERDRESASSRGLVPKR